VPIVLAVVLWSAAYLAWHPAGAAAPAAAGAATPAPATPPAPERPRVEQPPDPRVEEARRLINEWGGDGRLLERAYLQLDAALRERPDDAAALTQMARLVYKSG
jgi:hypothetical protein